jgi:hypothetical protein
MIAVPLLYDEFRQWREMLAIDARLQGPFMATALAFYNEFRFPLMLTSVMRSPAENAEVDGQPNSGHLSVAGPVRALDLRILAKETYPGLTPDQQHWLIDFWYRNFRFGRYWSAFVHRGNHIHIQCPKR